MMSTLSDFAFRKYAITNYLHLGHAAVFTGMTTRTNLFRMLSLSIKELWEVTKRSVFQEQLRTRS